MTSDQASAINRRIDGLTTAVQDLRLAVVKQTEECKPCRTQVEAHQIILQGTPENGDHPGLVTRVHGHEDQMKRIWKRVGWVAMAVGAVAVAILGAFAQAGFAKWL